MSNRVLTLGQDAGRYVCSRSTCALFIRTPRKRNFNLPSQQCVFFFHACRGQGSAWLSSPGEMLVSSMQYPRRSPYYLVTHVALFTLTGRPRSRALPLWGDPSSSTRSLDTPSHCVSGISAEGRLKRLTYSASTVVHVAGLGCARAL